MQIGKRVAKYPEKSASQLPNFAEEVGRKRRIVVCGEKLPRRTDDGTEIMPVSHFLDELWSDKLLS